MNKGGMRFPTRVSCGGRSYVALNREQLENVCRVLCAGRYVDAERVFQSWESFRAADAVARSVANQVGPTTRATSALSSTTCDERGQDR